MERVLLFWFNTVLVIWYYNSHHDDNVDADAAMEVYNISRN
jgi:hypothetical protein